MLSDLAELPSIQLTEKDSLRFELDSLTPFGREVAAKELRETPEIKKKAIEELRELLKRKFISDTCNQFLMCIIIESFFFARIPKQNSHIACLFLISVDTDLYVPIDNDDWIIRFLRPCKFYPDSARKLVRFNSTTFLSALSDWVQLNFSES